MAELSQDGVYAGNDAIVALSRTCKVNVVIHQLRTPRWEIRCSGPETATLHIAYLRGEHYCSVGPVHPGHSLPQLVSLGDIHDLVVFSLWFMSWYQLPMNIINHYIVGGGGWCCMWWWRY